MPDDEIRLTIPPDEDLVAVASIAVRAAARQVALPETEIDRLRAAISDELARQIAGAVEPIDIVLRPSAGALAIEVGGVAVA
jgi:hypothetical protein